MHDEQTAATDWRLEGADPDCRPFGPPLLRDVEHRTWLAVAGLVLALLMLASFYGVVKQAMGRAHDHWARAVAAADGCATESAPASAGCADSERGRAADLLLAGGTALRR